MYYSVSAPPRLRYCDGQTYYSGFMLRADYMWFGRDCVVSGGAEDSAEIPIIVKVEEE